MASYNRPGGNATGMNILTAALESKRLRLLHDLVPQAETIFDRHALALDVAIFGIPFRDGLASLRETGFLSATKSGP